MVEIVGEQQHTCELILTKLLPNGGTTFVVKNNSFGHIETLRTQPVVLFRDAAGVEHSLQIGEQEAGDHGRSFVATCATTPAGFPYVGLFLQCVLEYL